MPSAWKSNSSEQKRANAQLNDEFPALGGSVSSVSSRPAGAWGSSNSLQRVVAGVTAGSSSGASPPTDTPIQCPSRALKREFEDEVDVTYTPAESLPALQTAETIDVLTNSFRCKISPRLGFRSEVSIYKKGANYAGEMLLAGGNRKKLADCGRIFRIAFETLGQNADGMAYDGAATLYTTKKLKDVEVVLEDRQIPTDLKEEHFPRSSGKFRVVISPATTEPLLSTNVFNERLVDLKPRDHSTQDMLQMALSQKAKNDGFMTCEGGSQMFDRRRKKTVEKGIVELSGVRASLKMAEGKEANGEIHVVLDRKTVRFFKEGPLMDLNLPFSDRNQNDFLRQILRGLRVQTTYNQQVFYIDDVSKEPIREIKMAESEECVLVESARKANRSVSEYHGQWPAVQAWMHSKLWNKQMKFSFPVENLLVMPGQKLREKYFAPPAAPLPAVRWETSMKVAREAHLISPNPILEEFGVHIEPLPIELRAARVPMPVILYGGGASTVPDVSKKASWDQIIYRNGKGGLVEAAEVPSIVIAYNSQKQAKDSKVEEKVKEFSKKLKTFGSTMKMRIGQIRFDDLGKTYPQESAQESIWRKLDSLKGLTPKPLFIYADVSTCQTFEVLKLGERRFEIITLHLSLDKSLQQQQQVKAKMFNIVSKINTKFMGLNHKVRVDPLISKFWGDATETLIISYDVCHESGKKVYLRGEECHEPSVVGFAFNGAKNPEAIIGDFHFQLPRKERVDDAILRRRSKTMMDMFVAARQRLPTRVVVIRDGVSDGQYGMVVNHELLAIRQGIRQFLSERKVVKDPAYALLIATKRHPNRIFTRDANGKIDNAPPLTVIDHTVVRKNLNEMFFLTHCALTGTSKPIVLNLLVNQGVFRKKEEIVQLMATLCCSHQSSASVISLPETVYAADEYAKRGADMLTAYKEYLKNRNLPEDLVHGQWDFEAVTRKLCYDTSTFFRSRRMT